MDSIYFGILETLLILFGEVGWQVMVPIGQPEVHREMAVKRLGLVRKNVPILSSIHPSYIWFFFDCFLNFFYRLVKVLGLQAARNGAFLDYPTAVVLKGSTELRWYKYAFTLKELLQLNISLPWNITSITSLDILEQGWRTFMRRGSKFTYFFF